MKRLRSAAFVLAAMSAAAAPARAQTTVCGARSFLGIDINSPQVVNWPTFWNGGGRFAIVKATEGDGTNWYYVNSRFHIDYPAARAQGLYRGAYHYFHPELDGTAQANFYVSTVNAHGGFQEGDLPPMLDYEEPQAPSSPGWGLPASTVVARAQAWLDRVESLTGVRPMVYTYPYFAEHQDPPPSSWSMYPLVGASYSSCPTVIPPWHSVYIWQYTGCSTTTPGVTNSNGASCVNDADWFQHPLSEMACAHMAHPAMVPTDPNVGLNFVCGDARRTTSTGEWSANNFKAECAEGEAMNGLSAAVGLRFAHEALCSLSDARVFEHTTCRSVPLDGSAPSVAGAGDWDMGYYKADCGPDEYVAGISQTQDEHIASVLCCQGQVDHTMCSPLVIEDGDAHETGAPTTDWDPNYHKGLCGPDRYIASVSANTSRRMVHGVLCCGGIVPPPPTDAGFADAGRGDGGDAGDAGYRYRGDADGGEGGFEPAMTPPGCGCRVPGPAKRAPWASGVLVLGAAVAATRRKRRR